MAIILFPANAVAVVVDQAAAVVSDVAVVAVEELVM